MLGDKLDVRLGNDGSRTGFWGGEGLDARLLKGGLAQNYNDTEVGLRAKDVVLSTKFSHDSNEEPSRELVQLADGCPECIYARVSCFHYDNKDGIRPVWRQLWQPTRSDSSPASWEISDSSWTPRFISPPIQKRSGPVGTWLHWVNDGAENNNYMNDARRILFIQAIESYYLHTLKAPCICPFARCGLQFEEPGQWAAHYVSSDETVHFLDKTFFSCEMLQAAFTRQDARVKLILQRIGKRLMEMRDEWGEEGSDQRHFATQQFLEQLRDDPLCARQKVPEKSRIWRDYQIAMNDEWHENQE